MEEIEVVVEPAWARLSGEPEDWYEKFSKYYLPLGFTRTIAKAFRAFALAEHPEYFRTRELNDTWKPASWSQMANEWRWRDRARDYDVSEHEDVDQGVAKARQKIREITMSAVEALEEALHDPRLKVAAAKEILDRGGIVSASIVGHVGITITADDYEDAARKVEEWKNKKANG